MKQTFFAALAAATLILSACNNSSSGNHESHSTAENKDTMTHSMESVNQEVKTVAASFTSLDAGVSTSIRQILDHYLHVKNALAAEQAAEAASGAKAMSEAIAKLDKSLLTAEQKTAFDKVQSGLKEASAQIAKSGTDIKIQRSHFVQLSESTYELVKQFGGGRPLYHDHCPMARDNQGAMWISETREIKNPYFGDRMLTCGTVEEVIQ